MKKGKYIDSKGNYKKNALKELIALCQDADYKEKKQTNIQSKNEHWQGSRK